MVNISALYLGLSFEPQFSEFHAFLPSPQEIIATVQTCITRSSQAEMKKSCLTLSWQSPGRTPKTIMKRYQLFIYVHTLHHIATSFVKMW
jgi:hypothetical protein